MHTANWKIKGNVCRVISQTHVPHHAHSPSWAGSTGREACTTTWTGNICSERLPRMFMYTAVYYSHKHSYNKAGNWRQHPYILSSENVPLELVALDILDPLPKMLNGKVRVLRISSFFWTIQRNSYIWATQIASLFREYVYYSTEFIRISWQKTKFSSH